MAPPVADPAPGADSADEVAQQAPEAAGARRRPLLPLVALGLAALLLLAATIFLTLRVRAESATDEARVAALATSRDAARALFSYNHESLDEDFARGLALTTGEFREEYSKTTEEVVRDVATQYDAVVQANVSEAGVIRASPDEVVTLVFLNQVTMSTRVEGQKIDQSRVRMRLVERDGRWLVAQVEAL